MDSHIRIWDLERGSLVNTIEAFPVETWAVAWSRFVMGKKKKKKEVYLFLTGSSDGRFVASTSKTGNVNVWNAETRAKEQVLEHNGKFSMSIAFVRLKRWGKKIILLMRTTHFRVQMVNTLHVEQLMEL